MTIKNPGLLILILQLAFHLQSQAQQRKYVNDFLNLGVGGRGIGMAGAQVASVNDVTAAYWNPGGLNAVDTSMQVGLMHSEYFSGIAKYDYLGTAIPLKSNKGVLGVSVIRYAIDDIPYTLNLIQPDGSIDYTRIRAISAQDYAGLISFAKPFTLFKKKKPLQVMAGANLKIIHRNLGSMANAWGAGVDFGLQTRIKQWKLGAVVRDLTTTYTLWSFNFTDKEKQILAQTGNEIVSRSTEIATPRLILGGGRQFKINKKIQILAELNADITSDGKRYGNLLNLKPFSIDPRAGVEVDYNRLVYLRAGLGNFQRILDDTDSTNTKKTTLFQPSLGLGVNIRNFAIDYGFSSLNLKDNPLYSHFISLRVHITRKAKSGAGAKAAEDQPLKK